MAKVKVNIIKRPLHQKVFKKLKQLVRGNRPLPKSVKDAKFWHKYHQDK